ncbi:hypothetical protein CTEN210_13458 [Chaetoceros tenuissimus]|uniref:phosphatidyl-N-methylethanolamine N-methyltransferase n=1 Tax=Chaetoceros tenuissimus TaxID=426638 RepID=A0AAD3D347_9STRA|nr:hypothetical protein CTEN210_13458 [Chaetoceros tenuissimus]
MISILPTEMQFAANAFFLLGIERILYATWFIYPNSFKYHVRKGSFGKQIQNESLYWKNAMTLGTYIKVFQFGVCIYDLFFRSSISSPLNVDPLQLLLGLALIVMGQGLNVAVFKALGGIGVYYGYEFGYKVKRVSCFPYNVSWISDPQYWGVVFTIWGIYLCFDVNDFTFPLLETFWYLCSMKFLEHTRGRNIVQQILGPDTLKSV